jgi:MFS family permease
MHDELATEPTPAAFDRRALAAALWPIMPAILLGGLDATMVATAVGAISDDLGQLDIAPWIVTAYLLTASASTVTYGRLGDIHGRMRVLRIATVIFLAGSAFAAVSGTMGQLIVARGIQGAGGGGLVALALAALADSVPARARGRYLGYIGAVFAGCNLLGPLLAGVLLEWFGWRAVFVVSVPLGVSGLFAVSVRRHAGREGGERGNRLDVVGAVLLASLVTCTLLFLRRIEVGLGSPGAIAAGAVLAASGLLVLAWFLARQRRTEHPLLPLAMLANHDFRYGMAGIYLGSFVMFASLVYVPLYFQIVSPVSGIGAALLITPFMVGFLAGSILPARRLGRSGRYKRYPVLGAVFMLVGVALLSTVDPESVHRARVFLAITGLGVGLTNQVLLLVVQNGVRYADLGTATSATALARALGGASGIAAFSAVIGRGVLADLSTARRGSGVVGAGGTTASDRLVGSFTSGLNKAFLLAVPVAVVSLILAARLREQPLRESVRGD